TGITGITYGTGAYNFDQSNSTGTFSTGTGNVTLNGNTTVAADQNFTLASGVGTFTQNFVNDSNSSASTFNITNSAASGATSINGVDLALTGTDNGSGSNITNGVRLENVT